MEESRLPAVFRVQGEQLVVSERRSDAYVPSQHTISRRIFQREKREVEIERGREELAETAEYLGENVLVNGSKGS